MKCKEDIELKDGLFKNAQLEWNKEKEDVWGNFIGTMRQFSKIKYLDVWGLRRNWQWKHSGKLIQRNKRKKLHKSRKEFKYPNTGHVYYSNLTQWSLPQYIL